METFSPEQVRLPDLPSDLIELALKDLEKIESDERYEIDMAVWHAPKISDPEMCRVCLAGAVMVTELGARHKNTVYPRDFDEDTGNKLDALDIFRVGRVLDAFGVMGIDDADLSESLRSVQPIAQYYDSPKNFKVDMQALADNLRAAGF